MSDVSNPLKGEIWRVNFQPAKGQEIRKTRPAIVINENAIGQLMQRIVIPLTGWTDKYKNWPWMVKIPASRKNGLDKDDAADTSQIRSVSMERFGCKLGVITAKQLEEVLSGVVICIGYECPFCMSDNDI